MDKLPIVKGCPTEKIYNRFIKLYNRYIGVYKLGVVVVGRIPPSLFNKTDEHGNKTNFVNTYKFFFLKRTK